MRTDLVAERIARNDARFREANEHIRDSAVEYEMKGLLPFICECARPRCTDIAQLTLEEYEQIRARSTQFLNVIGHEDAAEDAAVEVSRNDRYVVVEKVGRAAEITAELDPRS
jgi:hypothetical protein